MKEDVQDLKSSKEEKLKELEHKQRVLPLVLGAFALGGFAVGVVYGMYQRSYKK